ncbi:MAG TPA: sigma-70 family RNA polymerase sigma factor [Gemmataceae bacterium]|jgi:RNA polymerase sigma factor (sigma-70 family)|nr:sigma-70 family RNA polymerase sigma factor [Gemmataceae bacterium]
MAKKSLDKVMRHIRMVAAVHAYRDLPDRELLERFTRMDDEAAFTVIIDRHGPMILGVCRRALGNLHDAEDVCQATFLVLARKAATIRKTTSLASWLHGVACRGAACFSRARARREHRERQTPPALPKDAAGEVSWREIQSILDEELEQLPQRYRAPLILCYLGGKTRDEAAQQLGLKSATLHGRLERGRNLLRERLTRRGLSLSAALFATALGESALRAALPASFVISSAKAALALAAGQTGAEGVISATVLTLTCEVLKTMFLAKVKLGTAAVICASLIATVTCGTWTSTGVAQDVKTEAAKAAATSVTKAESDEDFIRRLSRDLRGNEPTPTEVHFFVANKDAGKRQKLIDLFIQERQAKKAAQRMEADTSIDTRLEGTLLPIKRVQVYAPVEGFIVKIREGLKAGTPVQKGEELLRMRDTDLAKNILQLKMEIAAADATVRRAASRPDKDDGSDQSAIKKVSEAEVIRNQKSQLLESLLKRTNSTNIPGEFRVTSPLAGIVLNPDIQASLMGRNVKPNEPLLRVGSTDVSNPKLSDWEIELKIPQKHIGEVLEAFRDKRHWEELDVEFTLSSAPTKSFRGKLHKSKIANVYRDENNKADLGMLAWVRISGSDIPEEYRLTIDSLVIGAEVRAHIRSRSDSKADSREKDLAPYPTLNLGPIFVAPEEDVLRQLRAQKERLEIEKLNGRP